MGKQGPCYHCRVTSTPLWRNGPPEKPVLCNACGSRWRTKGTLANYTPLHARAEPDELEDYRVSRVRSISIKNKEAELRKRKLSHDSSNIGRVVPEYDQGPRKSQDEDTSNRSSSGSVMSNSESYGQFGIADASDLTGPAQSHVWETIVPSRKRTCVGRPKSSSVEKLTKDLYTILHEQQSSHFSGSSEEDLLFESDAPMVSVEIGHGSVLFRHPSSVAREEESEASSLSVDNRPHPMNEAYSRMTVLPVYLDKKTANFASPLTDKNKKSAGQVLQQGQTKRDKIQHEKLQILGNHNSPLSYVNLNDFLNLDMFTHQLTSEEQQQLLKYLPSVDNGRLPDSLKSMFTSPHFKENISSFQKLLAEGAFDLSLPGVQADECKILKRLALTNSTKSKWVEQYNLLKDVRCKNRKGGFGVSEVHNAITSGNATNGKRTLDCNYQDFPGSRTAMKSSKGMMKGSHDHKELMDNDSTCFSPRSLFTLPPDSSSLMLDSFQFVEENSDQDLLLDVPSNLSFPEAELLLPASNLGAQASTSSSSIYQQLVRP